jgi:mono/diheme cytochrome c family protein
MRLHCGKFLGTLLPFAFAASTAFAQIPPPNTVPSPTATQAVNPIGALTLSKCFQCHSDAIFRDQRQDQRAWEATLYRMLARGAVWSGEDIKAMAGFMATNYGPDSPKVVAPTPAR